nr:S1/P1 nuclease [uncultured Rhodopila sp.]
MAGSAGWLTAVVLAFALNVVSCGPAVAWGDEGHEVIALIAQARLDPAVRKAVSALLAADPDPLTAHTIAAEATWADKLRESGDARQRTRQWHFVDIEISEPDLDQACFGHPPVPTNVPASNGPAQECVVDKVQEFAAELANPATGPEEQIVALKFLLHFVGDLHQPLHASDDHDRGGNDKPVSAAGFKPGNLHHFWDTAFVERLGPNAGTIATNLLGHLSEDVAQAWSRGVASDWALETFRMGRDDAYGQLPQPNARGRFRLSDAYVAMATRDVATQLSKAGVRLAFVLNTALRPKR